MSSHDLRWSIERYPCDGEFSYGCPDLNLMGFRDIDELLIYMLWEIKKLEKELGLSSQKGFAPAGASQ